MLVYGHAVRCCIVIPRLVVHTLPDIKLPCPFIGVTDMRGVDYFFLRYCVRKMRVASQLIDKKKKKIRRQYTRKKRRKKYVC